MNKIRLELDALAVDSFETGATHRGAGTVRGHDQVTTTPQTGGFTCKWDLSGYETCVVECECTNRFRRCKQF